MGRIDKSPMQIIQNNLCKYTAFKEVKCNSLPFKKGLHIVTSFQRQDGKGGKLKNFTVEKCDKHLLSQVIKVDIHTDKLHG